MQHYQNEVRRAQRIRVKALPAYFLVYLNEVSDSLEHKYEQVEREEENERDKVLVIPIAQAVVDKRTVVIEKLNALVTDGAVEGCLRFDDLTVWAKVVQVESDVEGWFN